jgi:hypothetical protein
MMQFQKIFYLGLVYLSLCLSVSSAQAMCFLNFEQAGTLAVSDAKVGLGFSGGDQQTGLGLNTRFGLPKTIDLFFNTGTCSKLKSDLRTDDWGYAFEFGTKKEILSYQLTRLFEFSWSISGISFSSSDGLQSIGFRTLFLGSIPFKVTADQKAYLTIGLGGQSVFQDEKTVMYNEMLKVAQTTVTSQNLSRALATLGGGIDILKNFSLNGEFRFEIMYAFQAGASLSYVF